jgi:hypothetical protein
MKRNRAFFRLGLALLFCLSTLPAVTSASGAVPGNRCKDLCNDSYQRRKDACRGLRKYEKRRCEDRAKRARDECRRRCR